MSNIEVPNKPEESETNHWAGVFGVLSQLAKEKVTDHGRKPRQKAIFSEHTYNQIRIRVESMDVTRELKIELSVTNESSEKENIQPAKGIDMSWATGIEENYRAVEFELSKAGVEAKAKPLVPIDNDKVELQLVNDFGAANQLFYLASFAIDRSRIPHIS